MMHCTTLPNGLRVASRPMPSVETVAVGLYVDAGSRHEEAGQNGIAHLFEHMVFKGAGGRSAAQISEAVENVGGDLNASTDREGTAFYASLLSQDLPLGVELLSDLVRRPHFEERHLRTEKKVIAQELEEVRDTPGDIVFDHLQEAAFAGQAIGRSVLGDESTLETVSVADLQRWLDRHYRPGRLVLAAAGKLDHDHLVAIADRHFGSMTPGESPASEPARFTGGEAFEERPGRQAHLAVGMAAPAYGDSDALAAQLFADVVGVGAASRLFQQLREDQGLAYSVSAATQPFADCGLFSVYLATDRGQAQWALCEVERILGEAAATLNEAEVARARALAKAGMLMSLESCWGQAGYVASRLIRDGRLVEPAEYVARLDLVTVDAVREAGRRMLSGPRALACVGAKLAGAA